MLGEQVTQLALRGVEVEITDIQFRTHTIDTLIYRKQTLCSRNAGFRIITGPLTRLTIHQIA
jgi:hypothetical protein